MRPARYNGWILALAFFAGSAWLPHTLRAAPAVSSQTAPISASEFSRMVQDFSEPEGYWHSDVFTSNETSYLHVIGKLQELGVSGGAYIGVAPEQNFTYIAKIHPRIAFIVDIRRQAIIQHLLYKALFHMAADRAQFLALLFSRPFPPARLEKDDALEELLDFIGQSPGTPKAFEENLAAIQKTIQEDFLLPLSPEDVQSLEYVYTAFWKANLRIGSRFSAVGGGFWFGGMPTLKDLILETDLDGNRGNFLAHEGDYQFVRKLQEQNRVIPVVGDFGGGKALAAVASYLRTNGYTVSAFYTSNVEQFLYQDDIFGNFEENVSKLPINKASVFIRAVLRRGRGFHPASVPGYRSVTLLQKISVFLEDYKKGLNRDYWSLVTTHYIAGAPTRKQGSLPCALASCVTLRLARCCATSTLRTTR